jgi:hypothetical protein
MKLNTYVGDSNCFGVFIMVCRETGDKKFLGRVVAGVHRIQFAFNYFLHAVLICWFHSQYVNFAVSFSCDSLAVFVYTGFVLHPDNQSSTYILLSFHSICF